jgi:two-component system sensor histidine kinase VicK
MAFNPPKQIIPLQTDSLIVKEVLTNLVGNAIKYTPHGGKVTIKIRNNPKNVLFTIQDTGIGIPAEQQSKIFAKFFRAPNAVRQETTGTGLGLYVVRGLILILHGKIWFRSIEGTGSSFYVSLPKTYDGSTPTTP